MERDTEVKYTLNESTRHSHRKGKNAEDGGEKNWRTKIKVKKKAWARGLIGEMGGLQRPAPNHTGSPLDIIKELEVSKTGAICLD